MSMKYVIALVATLAVVVFAQSRTDTYDASTASPSVVHLSQLDDGGWTAQWCGVVPAADGGNSLRGCSGWYELKAQANRNKSDALANAGLNRWLKDLAFDVDAGNL